MPTFKFHDGDGVKIPTCDLNLMFEDTTGIEVTNDAPDEILMALNFITARIEEIGDVEIGDISTHQWKEWIKTVEDSKIRASLILSQPFIIGPISYCELTNLTTDARDFKGKKVTPNVPITSSPRINGDGIEEGSIEEVLHKLKENPSGRIGISIYYTDDLGKPLTRPQLEAEFAEHIKDCPELEGHTLNEVNNLIAKFMSMFPIFRKDVPLDTADLEFILDFYDKTEHALLIEKARPFMDGTKYHVCIKELTPKNVLMDMILMMRHVTE